MTHSDPEALATIYFDAWAAHDPSALRPALADEVSFIGPLATVDGADAYVESITGLFKATTSVEVQHRWVDGSDVLTWFHLTVGDGDAIPVASWIHADAGRISRVRVVFDPRTMT